MTKAGAFARRVGRGTRKQENWLQLVRFSVVGASGYVVNLAAFAFQVEVLGLHHILAAIVAFLIAVTNNFLWNRYWTFSAGDGHAGFQAARFLVVSIVGLGVNLAVLETLVSVDVPEIAAQAVAVAVATPVNFIGNKVWTFDR